MIGTKEIIIASAAFVGGLLSSLLGWFDAKVMAEKEGKTEIWSWNKFGQSVITSFGASLVFALGYSFRDTFGTIDVFVAVVGGLGLEAGTHRLIGSVNK